MKSAIILHGMPSKENYYNAEGDSPSNSHWLPWLQKQFLLKDILAQSPEMPRPFEPEYSAWKNVFEQFPINEETILVGHSCGGGFLVRWLSENNVKAGKVILVAPWLDPLEKKELNNDFFDFKIDPDLSTKAESITIFNSDNDDDCIQETVRILRQEISGIKYRGFQNYGHFALKHMNTREFPELLEECVN